ncbi:hypothetical protein JZK55_14570 [Dissulfurispira thermophila]|uniref:Uncharacterized protein n=1 Tax=Dissulfurispira thermophila TaxID=2715679 RepID=A0A7G1H157_9BACT|nr:hypothetical protein [Dissulfurispira thermophila]BCB96535.1 hypothetical protein JZK55_14570 [Dissulfurispira thermophila]
MKTISLSEEILDKLKIIEGKEIDEKIFNLLETNALMRLKECEERIFEFESRHGLDFEMFRKQWENEAIKDKHSHRVERDFMEWEGFEFERKKWLKFLRDIKEKV